MHPRIILAIALKDLRAATRDGRILLALLMPLGLGIVYNFLTPDDQKPTVTVALYSAEPTALPGALRQVAVGTVDLIIKNSEGPDDVRARVSSNKADVGLIVPAGFDAAIASAAPPTIDVLRPARGTTTGASYVITALGPALRQMAGQHDPAVVRVESVAATATAGSPAGQIGARSFLLIGVLIMLIAMVALFILPVLLTEEYEKKTADALLLIGSQTDLVLAKAAAGLIWMLISVSVFVVVTRLPVQNPILLAGAVFALAVALIGFGLLMGGLARTVTQLNTWSSIPLLLLIMPVFFAGIGLPAWVETVLNALPGNQAARLMVDAVTPHPVYGNWLLAFGLMAAWAAVGYGLLIRSLARREA